jgi:hypothetical protein
MFFKLNKLKVKLALLSKVSQSSKSCIDICFTQFKLNADLRIRIHLNADTDLKHQEFAEFDSKNIVFAGCLQRAGV